MSYLTSDYLEGMLEDETKMMEGIKQISSDIVNNVFTIVHFTDTMKAIFTSTVLNYRVQGVKLYARVLAQLPNDYLTQDFLSGLVTFYVQQLNDHHNMQPAVIEGFLALSKMTHISNDSVVLILTNIFQTITCAQQVLADRLRIYQILDNCIQNHSTVLKGMSNDFLSGLIGTIEGERDPHNLDLIFTFMENVVTQFHLGALSEDIFDTLSCYFPVDYRPSLYSNTNKEKKALTRDSLAAKLCQCMVGTSEFVEQVVQLATEKLSSELIVSKMDSLTLLSELAMKQPYHYVSNYFMQIWPSLRAEVIPGYGDKDVVAKAFDTLRCFLERANKAGKEVSRDNQAVILANIMGNLDDLNSNLYEPSIRVALVCVSTDVEFVTQRLLPIFIMKLKEAPLRLKEETTTIESTTSTGTGVLKNYSGIETYIRVFDLFRDIFIAASSTSLHPTSSETNAKPKITLIDKKLCVVIHELVLNALDNISENYKEKFFELLRSALSVLKASIEVIDANGDEKIIERIHKHIKWLVYHDELDLTEMTVVILQHLAHTENQFTSGEIDFYMKNFTEQSEFIKQKILQNLLNLAQHSPLKCTIRNWLYSLAFDQNDRVSEETRFLVIEALNFLLQCLDREHIVELQHDTDLIKRYIHLLKTNYVGKEIDEHHHQHLSQITLGLSIIMRSLPADEQYRIAKSYLKDDYKLDRFTDAYMAKGMLGFLDSGHSLEEHLEPVLNDIIQFSLEHANHGVREIVHHLFCSITNKIHHQKQVDRDIIVRLKKRLITMLHEGKEDVIELLSWMAKGLLMCNFDEGVDIIEALIDLLEHPNMSNAACLGFEIISAELSHLHLHLPVCGFLFKQKLIHYMLEKMGKHLIDPMAAHHQRAFITILKIIPHHILKMYILQIGPILFRSVNTSENPKEILISLVICENFVRHKDEYFRDRLKSYVPACLKLSRNMSSMNVRIAALHLLSKCCAFPAYILQPFKADVILGVKPALDDPKRLVRKVAVTASNLWYLV